MSKSALRKERHGEDCERVRVSEAARARNAIIQNLVKMLTTPGLHPRQMPSSLNEWIRDFEGPMPETDEDGKKVGSKSRMEWFQKMTPQMLSQEAIHNNSKDLWMFAFEMTMEELPSLMKDRMALDFNNSRYILGILSKVDLSFVPEFLLYSRDGNIRVCLKNAGKFDGTSLQIEKIRTFQRLLFSDDPELLRYSHPAFVPSTKDNFLIAPLQKFNDGTFEIASDVITALETGQFVNYNQEMSVQDRKARKCNPKELEGALVIPFNNPSQKYCVLRVEPSRHLSSQFPDYKKGMTFVEYYSNKGIKIVREKDPLLQSRAISGKQVNYLMTRYDEKKEPKRKGQLTSLVELAPELVRAHPLPAAFFLQGRFLPCCIHRVFRFLLAKEIIDAVDISTQPKPSQSHRNRQRHPGVTATKVVLEKQPFDGSNELPSLQTIMEAITLANGKDFYSLEKLEMIGDSVLKLVVSLHLFTEFPKYQEGQLTSLRTKLISNRHLYLIGKRKSLGECLAGGYFDPEAWVPPGQEVPVKLSKYVAGFEGNYNIFRDKINPALPETQIKETVKLQCRNNSNRSYVPELSTSFTHSIVGDKSIADCVESLIGAYYMSGGVQGALNFMKWVGFKAPTGDLPTKDIPYRSIAELAKAIRVPCPTGEQNFLPQDIIQELEKTLKYRFKNQWLLVEAFTHSSFIKNQETSAYQRLEFLGDAVLDFLITQHIYDDEKLNSPGLLTDMRSALVNNTTFAVLTVRHNFHKLLLQTTPELDSRANCFATSIQRNGYQISDRQFDYIVEEDGSIVATDVEVPKALGDVFESLAGAVFIDSGMSLNTVWGVFHQLMKSEIEKFSTDIPQSPLRKLYERFPGLVTFRETNGPKGFVVELKIEGHTQTFRGVGQTKKSAKEVAAKFALQQIERQKKKKR